jgi:hypothetical protein
MSYRAFTLRKAKEELNLNFVEGVRFLPDFTHQVITPSPYLTEFLQESIPLAIAMGSEKARSELIISPILFEVRKQLNRQISFFSGEEFNVDESIGLNGVCDFLISRSTEQLFVDSPIAVIVEAKKDDLKSGLGQCIAEMVAAQRFNLARENAINVIYGSVTSGNRWIFLQLKEQTLTIDLEEYVVPPIDWLLNALVWMCSQI